VSLIGPGGMLIDRTKRVLETRLEIEMTEHLGYEKHAVEGRHCAAKERLVEFLDDWLTFVRRCGPCGTTHGLTSCRSWTTADGASWSATPIDRRTCPASD
jgi:hypothetical protein